MLLVAHSLPLLPSFKMNWVLNRGETLILRLDKSGNLIIPADSLEIIYYEQVVLLYSEVAKIFSPFKMLRPSPSPPPPKKKKKKNKQKKKNN